MKILAMDSSSLVASVAVLEDEVLLAEYTINYKKTHSQTLLPMIDEIAGMIELDLHTIDAIAVSKGPGSFTGLRIGSATAKGLGLALDKPIIAVPTLEAMAYNLWGNDALIVPIMDARRNQVYTGIYRFRDGVETVVKEQCAIAIEELIEELDAQKEKVVFLGDGVPVFRDRIEELLHTPHEFAPPHNNRQRAAAVGALAFRYYEKNIIETAAEHRPDYLRLSQAERERKEREAGN